MAIIFLDTSIFVSNNFWEGKRIKEIFHLAEKGDVQIILPEIIYDEIKNILSRKLDDEYQNFRNKMKILRSIPSLSSRFEHFSREDAKKEIFKIVDQKFQQSKVEIIPYMNMDVKEIFEAYFNQEPPFGPNNNKKHEFPDAFALKMLEKWAEEKGEKILLFSQDKDMTSYTSQFLEVRDFATFVDEKVRQQIPEDIQNQIEDFILHQNSCLKSEIKDWVEYQLDDSGAYYEHTNYLDVHDLTIENVTIDILDYKITNTVKNRKIFVEVMAAIHYEVEVLTDNEDDMIRDPETKTAMYFSTINLSIKKTRKIKVDAIFETEPDDDRFIVYEPDITSINGGENLIV